MVAVVFAVLTACAIFLIVTMPRTYQAAANVLIVNGNSRNDPTLSSADLPSIVGGTTVLERVQRQLRLTIPLPAMKRSLTTKTPAYRSGIMRIQYTDSDPTRATRIVNGVADELAKYYTELSTARYDADLHALDVEISKQRKHLESIDKQLKAQGDEDLATDDGRDAASSGSAVGALESQRAAASADLQSDMAHAQAASIDASRDVLASDPSYQQLQASLSKASGDLAEARAHYTAQYPGMSALQSRVDSLKTAVAQEAATFMSTTGRVSSGEVKARGAIDADRAKVTAFDDEVAAQRRRLNVTGPLELLLLERQQVLRQYQSIAAHRASLLADRVDALSLGSIDVVDRAIPGEEQRGPGPIRLTLIAAFLMSLVALGSAFFAEQLDPSLRRGAQIEALYGKPLIAILKTPYRLPKANEYRLPNG